jgi:transcriptional regulator with XRE-family HTH domain
VDPGIGETLREARNRRNISLSAAEGALKIRVRYLRAIENEEWGELPGGAYTRSFIRTYASYLGLDGDRLAEEHLEPAARPPDRSPRVEAAPISPSGARRGPRWAPLAVALAALALAVLVVVAIGGGGNGGGSPQGRSARSGSPARVAPPPKPKSKVALSVAATAEVWVCLLDAAGRPLIDGQVLPAGEEAGPFHSDSFTVSFGNGGVAMRVNGTKADIPESASPLGYAVSRAGALTSLSESQRPTCA